MMSPAACTHLVTGSAEPADKKVSEPYRHIIDNLRDLETF